MTLTAVPGVVAVVEGLFVDAPEPRLVGSRCRGCGVVYFPQSPNCRNPSCSAKQPERVLLASAGNLLSFTIQRYRPPDIFRMDHWAPYAIGLVDLGDGVRVMGMLTGIAFDDIRIGMPLVLVIETLFVDAIRGSVTTYKFAPSSDGKAS